MTAASQNSAPTGNAQIEDVQGRPDPRQLPINNVGIRDIRHPLRVSTRDGAQQTTIGEFAMYVALPHNVKGTHMSRFVEMLNTQDAPLSVASFRDMLAEMTRRLEAHSGTLDVHFPYFVEKTAPVSGVKSLMDYQATFSGEQSGKQATLFMQVIVPVTSLCPCSREISAYGAHNQRSHVTLKVRADQPLWPEDLIDIVESQASSELYGILKRPDEKFVTEGAYDNPKFVEDVVRDIATRMNEDARIGYYEVAAENFESIHNHSAYAQIIRDKAQHPPQL